MCLKYQRFHSCCAFLCRGVITICFTKGQYNYNVFHNWHFITRHVINSCPITDILSQDSEIATCSITDFSQQDSAITICNINSISSKDSAIPTCIRTSISPQTSVINTCYITGISPLPLLQKEGS